MNGSSLVDFAPPTVVGANSMCRVGSCLQLFQLVFWSANTFLVVHSSLIGFSQQYLAWLQCSKLFSPCLDFFFLFTLCSTWILSVSVQLIARTSCYYPYPSFALPIKVTLWQEGDWPVSSILLWWSCITVGIWVANLNIATASSQGECIPSANKDEGMEVNLCRIDFVSAF